MAQIRIKKTDIDATEDTAADSTKAIEQQRYPVVELNDGRKSPLKDVWRIDDEEGEILAAYYHMPLTLKVGDYYP